MMFVLILFASVPSAVFGYNILALFPYPARSHYSVIDPLLVELSERGHRVTVYSSFPKRRSVNVNYTDIDVAGCFRLPPHLGSVHDMANWYPHASLQMIFDVHPTYEEVTGCRPLMEILKTPPGTYDLVITSTFNNDVCLLIAGKLGVPYIGMIANVLLPWLSSRMGNPDNPSYTPQMVSGLLPRMTFLERLVNTYIYLISLYLYDRYSTKKTDAVGQRLFGSSFPSIDEIVKNTSLTFAFTHFGMNPARPLLPAVVEIGGINVKPANQLPEDIEKFINGSEHGVIYFCMGSLLRGSSFPEDKRKAFLYAFSKIPQRVLWKWEGDNLPGKPDNVMIAKWMPQRDILAHPNVKLFISHGGLLGTNEAVYEGVPILGIPIFGDQRTNVKSIEASGAGELLDYNDISDEVVFGKIQKLLHDPKYRENAKELSRRYRDRPMSPLDTAVYWTEYVIRHKGAHHLRSAAVDLPWYQYLLLDVIAFVLLVLVVSLLSVYYSIKFTLRFIFRKLFGKKQPTKSEKSKKKLN